MSDLLATLGTVRSLFLFLLGFGFIVFVHELGHFLAARWAGVRVLAFAVGFGKAICSYRKGIGFRWGSSEPEYLARLRVREPGSGFDGGVPSPAAASGLLAGVSPTEYRLNLLPFGGYVKMLGQDDLDPGAVSGAPDSYQNCPVFKRMVIICAGVVMNIIFAALAFGLVFSIGLRVEPPIIGGVADDSPAAVTVAVNASDRNLEPFTKGGPGLRAGDRVVSIDGRRPNTFQDIMVGAAMSEKDTPIRLVIERRIDDGSAAELTFDLVARKGEVSGLLEIGVEPHRSTRIPKLTRADDIAQFRSELAKLGLDGLEPGMMLTSAGGISRVRSGHDLTRAIRESNGAIVPCTFEDPTTGARVNLELKPRPAMMLASIPPTAPTGGGPEAAAALPAVQHLLGLTPVMSVRDAKPNTGWNAVNAADQGIRTGDVFLRIGSGEYPSVSRGMAEIRAHAGAPLTLVLARPKTTTGMPPDSGVTDLSPGSYEVVELTVNVSREGRLGFFADDTAEQSTVIARPPQLLLPRTGPKQDRKAFTPAAARFFETAGTRILAIEGESVSNFAAIRSALRRATKPGAAASISVTVAFPAPAAATRESEPQNVRWVLDAEDVAALHELGWESPLSLGVFALDEAILKRDSIGGAMGLGIDETRRVMATTYLTFARLFQRTVKVEHLKGPVGIAHMGTLVAEKGTVWLLFFLALISVNLAVINFLPLPIVDGGQFILLVIEALRGRPAPIQLQNGLTLAGLVMIGCIFLVVTFNDIKNLLGI